MLCNLFLRPWVDAILCSSLRRQVQTKVSPGYLRIPSLPSFHHLDFSLTFPLTMLRVTPGTGTGRVSVIRQSLSATVNSTKKPRKASSSVARDAVGRSIDLAKAVSSIGSATPVPWISTAADAVVNLLQVFQVCMSVLRHFEMPPSRLVSSSASRPE